jgi:hypothetical protein
MSKLINIYSIELLKGISLIPIGTRHLIDISYTTWGDGFKFKEDFELGISLTFSWSVPIHIGIILGNLTLFIQVFGIKDQIQQNQESKNV